MEVLVVIAFIVLGLVHKDRVEKNKKKAQEKAGDGPDLAPKTFRTKPHTVKDLSAKGEKTQHKTGWSDRLNTLSDKVEEWEKRLHAEGVNEDVLAGILRSGEADTRAKKPQVTKSTASKAASKTVASKANAKSGASGQGKRASDISGAASVKAASQIKTDPSEICNNEGIHAEMDEEKNFIKSVEDLIVLGPDTTIHHARDFEAEAMRMIQF